MDERWMREALAEAEIAMRLGEVPIGAVIVSGGRVIGRGGNAVERCALATAHAEMAAIRSASHQEGDWRLDGATLYVTVEPCHMCLGAVYLCRMERVVFGARQPRSGACGSAGDLHRSALLGHKIEVAGGVLEGECLLLLQRFFTRLRAAEKTAERCESG